MTDALYFYVSIFCVQRSLFQGLPAAVNYVLEFLAGWYAVPVGLLLTSFIYWFVGKTATDRLAIHTSQRPTPTGRSEPKKRTWPSAEMSGQVLSCSNAVLTARPSRTGASQGSFIVGLVVTYM